MRYRLGGWELVGGCGEWGLEDREGGGISTGDVSEISDMEGGYTLTRIFLRNCLGLGSSITSSGSIP